MRLNTEANRTMIDRPGPLHLAPTTAASTRKGAGKTRPAGSFGEAVRENPPRHAADGRHLGLMVGRSFSGSQLAPPSCRSRPAALAVARQVRTRRRAPWQEARAPGSRVDGPR